MLVNCGPTSTPLALNEPAFAQRLANVPLELGTYRRYVIIGASHVTAGGSLSLPITYIHLLNFEIRINLNYFVYSVFFSIIVYLEASIITVVEDGKIVTVAWILITYLSQPTTSSD